MTVIELRLVLEMIELAGMGDEPVPMPDDLHGLYCRCKARIERRLEILNGVKVQFLAICDAKDRDEMSLIDYEMPLINYLEDTMKEV